MICVYVRSPSSNKLKSKPPKIVAAIAVFIGVALSCIHCILHVYILYHPTYITNITTLGSNVTKKAEKGIHPGVWNSRREMAVGITSFGGGDGNATSRKISLGDETGSTPKTPSILGDHKLKAPGVEITGTETTKHKSADIVGITPPRAAAAAAAASRNKSSEAIPQRSRLFAKLMPKQQQGEKTLKEASSSTSESIESNRYFFEPDVKSYMNQNHYSGMYWTDRETVLKLNPNKILVFAQASVELFNVANNVVMPKDWLDCSVEHWSKLPKHFIESQKSYKRDDKIFQRLVEIISSYFYKNDTSSSRQLNDIEQSPARETLVVLPLYEMEEAGQTMDSLLSLDSKRHGPKERVAVLTMYALAATIASLWRVGMARVVIVGRTAQQPELVRAAFYIVEKYINKNSKLGSAVRGSSSMELAYVRGISQQQQQQYGRQRTVVLMPKVATQQLQAALRGALDPSETKAFLGDNPSKWKYIYFSEPDLILHTRSSVFGEFKKQLDQGNAIAAVRLQVMPHEQDFPGIKGSRILIPNVGHFADFKDLDPQTDSCCDAGQYWPGMKDYKKCDHVRFYQCGFAPGESYNETQANEAHKRLLKYPMIRFSKTGLGIYLLQNHGRLCYPGKIGACK